MTRINSSLVDRDIGLQMILAGRALAKLRASQGREQDVTPKGATALVLVNANPGITQADLARYFGNERTTMHGIIQSLLAAGLLAGKSIAKRGHALALHMTPQGKAVVLGELRAIDAQFEFLCNTIGQAATLELTSHLMKISAAAGAVPARPILSITGETT